MNNMSNFGKYIYRGDYMKKRIFVLLMLLLLPLNIYAYSDKVVLGGETIGIDVYSKGVYIVGFYDVKGKSIGSNAGFEVGDIIIKIDNNSINNINDLNNSIKDNKIYTFTVKRNNKIMDIDLNVIEEDNILKTGLYVKDQIYGIGTLSYIDPNTLVFGSLGHEILESNSFSKFDISNGNIYKADVISIDKSVNGDAGEKNAYIDRNNTTGEIYSNEVEGIFGKYTDRFDSNKLIDVGLPSEIKLGDAYIRTVINESKIDKFTIKILNIDENNSTKNIMFEITDKKLLDKTGGIVQGMSGSPIIQNNKIIGVVNYVIVDNTSRGYGIFITKMLEEGDKILQ